MKGRIIIVVLWVMIGVPLAALLQFLGVPLPFGLAWILAFAAAVLIAQQNFVDESEAWPPAPPAPVQRGSDVSRLAWAIDTRSGMVGPSLRRRVSVLAERRLREHGVDPDLADEGAVDAVLGPGAHSALTAPVMLRGDLERILRTLEDPRTPANQERR
ncbi:MAG: hypothetical protein JSS74_14180 [Actinobacteria bacterium]|nr:hypothetical protein [Actinomycetota bacterium]